MPKKKPRKPTAPYGYINFPKKGTVEKRMFQLSEEKETQEREVVERFAERLADIRDDVSIVEIVDLPEADHDFVLRTKSGAITVQLTEIPERDFTIEITKEEYNSGKYHSFIQKAFGELPLAVDEARRDSCIQRSIENKLAKHYAKGGEEVLWLLIFTTSTYLQTAYWEKGARQESPALRTAYHFLATRADNLFDEIWITNLLTDPIRVWPGVEQPSANRVGVTGLRPSPLPHHPACGSAPGGSDET